MSQATASDPVYVRAHHAQKTLGLLPDLVNREALRGRVKTQILPGQAPRFLLSDLEALAAERKAQAERQAG